MAGLTNVIRGKIVNWVRPPLSEVIVMGCPEGSGGIVNLTWKEPRESAWTWSLEDKTCPPPSGPNRWSVEVIDTPLKRRIRVSEAAKPVPFSESVSPERPSAESGETIVSFFWTSKLPFVLANTLSVPTCFTPVVADGITIRTWKTPVSSVVTEPSSIVPTPVDIIATEFPPNVIRPTSVDSGNPVPITITASSGEPKTGLTSTRLVATSERINWEEISLMVCVSFVVVTVKVIGPKGKSVSSPPRLKVASRSPFSPTVPVPVNVSAAIVDEIIVAGPVWKP